jgi:AraC-like DNA-binding protein
MKNGNDLFALRRALWEIAEHAQKAIAQLETYIKAQTNGVRSLETVDTTDTAEMSARAAHDGMFAAPAPAADTRQLMAMRAAVMTRAALRPGYSREVARALRHIELHFERPIGLARLARVAGCSTSTLTRAFRRDLGQTPREYLIGIRLARAACAMASGDKVESVMLAAGFRSKRNFYRLFKAQFGQTPADFRVEGESNRSQEASLPP